MPVRSRIQKPTELYEPSFSICLHRTSEQKKKQNIFQIDRIYTAGPHQPKPTAVDQNTHTHQTLLGIKQ